MTAVQGHSRAVGQMLGGERLEAFVEQVCRGWKRDPTEAELEQMALYFQAARYNPWARPPQMIFTLRWDKNAGQNGKDVLTAQKTIDGLRLDAYRSHDIVTMLGPEWCAEDGVWRDVWLKKDNPAAARFGIQKRGASAVQWSVVTWAEWAQDSSFWKQKPAHMLAKTAETLALKRALPTETDPLAIAHQREMERLAVGNNVEAFERALGPAAQSFELPPFEPLSARAPAFDRPRPSAHPELPPPDQQAPKPKRTRELADLYAEYGALLAQARAAGVVPEGELSKWLLPEGADRMLVVERGTALRAGLNRQAMDRTLAANAQSDDDDRDDLGADDDVSAVVDVGEDPLLVTGVTDPEYQKLSDAIEQAARADIDFDDCRIDLSSPVPVTEVVRKRQILEGRIAAVKEAMAGNTRNAATTR